MYKEVTDLSADNVISLGGTNRNTGKANPKSIEGYYLGKKQVADKKKQSGFSYIYIFQTPKGNVGVWGKTDLDRKMNQATPGTMVRASHVGMQATPNGEMYKYKVEVDSDNTIEVTADSSDSVVQDDGPGDEDEIEATSDEEDAEVQTAVLSAAARKAKVDALLKGKRN